jgi:hypothetical protein
VSIIIACALTGAMQACYAACAKLRASESHPFVPKQTDPPAGSKYLVIEEFTSSDVVRHYIALPGSHLPTGAVQGFAAIAVARGTAEQIAAEPFDPRAFRRDPMQSESAVVLTGSYDLEKSGSGYTVHLSDVKIHWSRRMLAAWMDVYADDKGRVLALDDPARPTYQDHWKLQKFTMYPALAPARTFVLSNQPDKQWQIGVRHGGTSASANAYITYRVETPQESSTPGSPRVGLRASSLDPEIRFQVVAAPTSPEYAVISFFGSARLQQLAPLLNGKAAILTITTPSRNWQDIMWHFRCAREQIDRRYGASLPVYTAGFSAGGMAAVQSDAWFPGEVQGVLCDGSSNLMVFNDSPSFATHGDIPVVHFAGRQDTEHFDWISKGHTCGIKAGRTDLMLVHAGGHQVAPLQQYLYGLNWLISHRKGAQ